MNIQKRTLGETHPPHSLGAEPHALTQAIIMMVDDQATNLLLMRGILEKAGYYRFVLIEDSTRAVAELEHHGPDILLLDLVMPGKTGINLFMRLRRKDEPLNTIPLIIITGIKEQLNVDWKDIVSRSRARTPDGFVEKPVTPERLMRVVNNVLSGKPKEEVQFG